MSQVNLLPKEILERQKTRRTTAFVAFAGALALLAIVAFYLVQNGRLGTVNGQISDQEAQNAIVQGQIGQLKKYADLQTQAQQQEALLASAWAGEVSFSGQLMDVSRVIPSDMALTALQFTLQPPTSSSTTTTTTTPQFVGSMSSSGEALTPQTIATWLARLQGVKGWENPWATNTTLTSDPGSYTLSTSVDLSTDVVTPRGKAGMSSAG